MIYNMFRSMGFRGYPTKAYPHDIDSENRPRLNILNDKNEYRYLDKELDNIVVHDHTFWVPDDPENWWLIYSTRVDIIAQSLSEALANRISEYHAYRGKPKSYTDIEYEPFEVDSHAILGKCKYRQTWNKNLDRIFSDYNWFARDVVNFETLIEKTPKQLLDFLGNVSPDLLPDDYSWASQKSPRITRDMITNYDLVYNSCKREI